MSYTFDPGQYVGDGIWRGTFNIYWANNPISHGCYELRMLQGCQGTISVRDGPLQGAIAIGYIDVAAGVLVIKGVTYRP
jgi:hypothetical protein